jgi:hypothetical protein
LLSITTDSDATFSFAPQLNTNERAGYVAKFSIDLVLFLFYRRNPSSLAAAM